MQGFEQSSSHSNKRKILTGSSSSESSAEKDVEVASQDRCCKRYQKPNDKMKDAISSAKGNVESASQNSSGQRRNQPNDKLQYAIAFARNALDGVFFCRSWVAHVIAKL